MKFKTYFTYIGFGLLVFILSGCSLLPEETVDEKSVPSVVQEQTKEYRSEFMKISLQIPVDWVVEEKANWAEIKFKSGKITISRSGTNWDNLIELLADFDNKRPNLTVLKSKKLKTNGYETIARVELFDFGNKKNEKKVYYIFTINEFFTLSTSTPELYDDLDQITQSFRYFGK